MTSLATHLTSITETAFEALSLPLQHARVQVSAPEQPSQFQCNGAMACAKIAGKNPREIAQNIVQEIEKHPGAHTVFQNLEIAGPGFINITLNDKYIAKFTQIISKNGRFGIKQQGTDNKIILDYGGPNIAKNMHVGHLRSSIIGDFLRRIYNYGGVVAIGDVHMGDWGTPMGMILSELDATNFDGDVTMEMLAEIYPKASTECKENPVRMEA
ncbi:MAG: arginine--tRNA ligase, partial [Alphaproteobacteria bacterium]|nr:arginine--tRNA ligase [Alphaproteobacteria bacterium]